MENSGETKIEDKDVSTIKTVEDKLSSPKMSKGTRMKVILVAIALLGAGIGIAGLVLYFEKGSETDPLIKQIAEKDAIIVELQETLAECSKGLTDISNAATNTHKNSLLHIDAGKCLNCEIPIDSIISGVTGFSSNLFSHIRLNTSTISDATIMWVSWDALNAYYSYTNSTNTVKTGTEYNVKIDLSGKAVDVLVGSLGNGLGGETLLFLMEDGTVEYIPVIKAMQEGKFQSYGKIPDVESVVKFYTAHNYGGAAPLAQRADGDYYDLGVSLSNTGNYHN